MNDNDNNKSEVIGRSNESTIELKETPQDDGTVIMEIEEIEDKRRKAVVIKTSSAPQSPDKILAGLRISLARYERARKTALNNIRDTKTKIKKLEKALSELKELTRG